MESPEFERNLYVAHQLSRAAVAAIEQWDALVAETPRTPETRWQRRRRAFVRAATTSASTRIEGNQLSLWDADQLLVGMRVEGQERDQREVRNYAAALDLAEDFLARESFEWQESVLQQLNAAILRGLEHDTRGAYRTGPVTVGGGFYAAPSHAVVPAFVSSLVDWLGRTTLHPLVRTALLHLNLAAIHPWFDGNGRTTRIACLLDISRIVSVPGWVNIEPALATDQDGYFRRIRDAVGMSWDPQNHVASEWVEWYVGLHLSVLRQGIAIDEAERRDAQVITAALEERGQPADWGPIILTAAYGPFGTSLIAPMYDLSDSATRAMVGRLVSAGWLIGEGRTRGRVYRPSERVTQLGLESPRLAQEAGGAR
mgnify:FL=1